MAYDTKGNRLDPLRGFKFQVTTAQVPLRCGFNKVSGLTSEIDVFEYKDGCDQSSAYKLPNGTTYTDIVLEHGLSLNREFQTWMNQVKSSSISSAPLDQNNVRLEFRRTLIISLYALSVKGNAPVRIWEIPNAWPKKIDFGEFNAQSSEVVIESIEITHEGFNISVLNEEDLYTISEVR